MSTKTHLAVFMILSLMLIGIIPFHSWGEPRVIVGLGPRVDTTPGIPFREERLRSITLIRVGPRMGVSGKSPPPHLASLIGFICWIEERILLDRGENEEGRLMQAPL